MDPRQVGLVGPGLRIERQPVAHRRVTGDQVAAFAAQEPRPGLPARGLAWASFGARDRQHVADHLVQALTEHLADALAFQRVGQARVERVDVARQLAFAPQVVPGVLESREHVLAVEPEPRRHAAQQALRLDFGGAVILVLAGMHLGMRPDRFAVLAPVQVQRPARQLFTGIPLALAVMQQAARAVTRAQLVHQVGAEQAFRRPHRFGVPFGAFAVVDRHESGLATLRQPHVVPAQLLIHLVPERLDLRPLRLGVRQRDARRLPDARHLHVVLELGLALVDRARHGCCRARFGRTGQRDVALARQQPRSRVQADPAGARQVDLAPGVQVGEIDLGAARAVERLHVAFKLDEVARHETRRQPQVAQHLHQQPAGVAARTAAVGKRLLGRLHARLHADQVADVALQLLVEFDQKIVGVLFGARNAGDIGLEAWRQRRLDKERCQLGGQRFVVAERKIIGRRLEKEVERVEHRHLGHQVDLDPKRRGLVREHQPRQVV